MAARGDAIDIAGLSSSDDGERGGSSPDLLAPTPSPPPPSPTGSDRKRPPNRKRAAASPPPPQPHAAMPSPATADASRREMKQEALRRARQSRDERKRPAAATAVTGRGGEVDLTTSPPPFNSGPGRKNARSKMTTREKREARERARQWHEHRNRGRNGNYHREEEISEGSGEEEVVDLMSSPSLSPIRNDNRDRPPIGSLAPSAVRGVARGGGGAMDWSPPTSNWPPPWMERRRARFPNDAARSSAAAGVEEPLRGTTAEVRHPRARATRPSPAAAVPAAGGTRGARRDETREWACPRCTLLNPHYQSRCGACYHENAVISARWNGLARGSPEGRVYEVDDDGSFFPEGGRGDAQELGGGRPPPFVVGGGAAPDAASAFRLRQGRSIAGAVTGFAMQQQFVASLGGGGWGRPRFRDPGPAGGIGRGRSQAQGGNSYLSEILLRAAAGAQHDMALRNAHRQLRRREENLDGMGYERLLELFGDGGENRGASSQAIESLPITRISDPEKDLPEGKRECSICLEDFKRGDERTSLPCLHGFHSACVNRWLASNGTCPMCKTSVSGSE